MRSRHTSVRQLAPEWSRLRKIATAATCLLVCLTSTAGAQTTVLADAFVDSVGVNVHLHYNDTLYYDNFPLVRSRLQELRVRHVRDGLIDTTWLEYYTRHNSLGQAGIKGTFIIGLDAHTNVLQAYPSRMANAFEAYEAPNEPNDSGDPDWADKVHSTLRQVRDVQRTRRFPIYGPSLTNAAAYEALGDISAWVDAGNMHNYFAGRHPGTDGWGADGYGSLVWNLSLVKRVTGNKMTVTTETGYRNDQSAPDWVPGAVAGRYMPRLLLEQFRNGIARTFIYELVDSATADQYGLLTRDGNPKPAFNAVKNLLSLLTDPGPAVPLQPLEYLLENEPPDLHHMAFQKRNGSYYLALWLERSSYDVDRRRTLDAVRGSVTVTVPNTVRIAAAVNWQTDGTTERSSLGGEQTETVDVSDDLTILELQSTVPPPPQRLRIGGRSSP